MKILEEATLKSIALEHYEYIPILEKYSLDFCCRGKKTLKEACVENDLSLEIILDELNEAGVPIKYRCLLMKCLQIN